MTVAATPRERPHLDSLTSIRFWAALVVFLYHAGYYLPVGELRIFGAGMSGVSLFYILSGFVMAWVFDPNDRASNFYRRRFARIYPAYVVSVTIAIVVSAVVRGFEASNLVAYTLLQAWSPAPSVFNSASPVFWSLSCETFFYIMFPLLASRLFNASTRLLAIIAACAIIAVISIGAIASFFWDNATVSWLAYVFPPTRSIEFVLGIALGFLVRRGFRLRVPAWVACILAVTALVLASFAPDGLRFAAVTVIPFVVLIVSFASHDVEGLKSGPASRILVKLGVWSYCFYLIHAMVQGWSVKAGLLFGISPVAGLAVALISSIVGAWLLHILVERLAEKRLRPRQSATRLDTDEQIRSLRS